LNERKWQRQKQAVIVTFELSAAVFVSQGSRRSYQPLHFCTDCSNGAIAAGDRNVDGKIDVLVGKGADRPSVSLLLN